MGRTALHDDGTAARPAQAGRAVRRVVTFAIRAVRLLAVLLLLVIGLGPRTGQYRVLTVLSGSMRPTLPVGSMVIVTPEPVGSVRAGHVITFERPLPDREVVTHRVVKVEHERGHPVVLTRGDANNGNDPWRAELAGTTAWRARAVVPAAGRVLELVRSRRTSHLMMRIVPVLLALAWLAQIWLPARSERDATGPEAVPARRDPAPLAPPSWRTWGALGALGVAAVVMGRPAGRRGLARGWLRA